MTIELERVSIGGVWQWQAVNEGGGGGGSVAEITSDDNSVTITNPTGPTVDLSVSGGGGAFPARLDFAFDTPDLFDGVPIFTPQAGDSLLFTISYLDNPLAWNGTDGATPTLRVFSEGTSPLTQDIAGAIDLTSYVNGTAFTHLEYAAATFSGVYLCIDATRIMVAVDDGSGGDSGPTSGDATLTLMVLPAA